VSSIEEVRDSLVREWDALEEGGPFESSAQDEPLVLDMRMIKRLELERAQALSHLSEEHRLIAMQLEKEVKALDEPEPPLSQGVTDLRDARKQELLERLRRNIQARKAMRVK
jgi:hypothetical protein